MKKQIRVLIGIIIILIGIIISLKLLCRFYNQGDFDGKFRVFYSELWALNKYTAFIIYSLLLSIAGGLLLINHSKVMIVFEIIMLGSIIELMFGMNQIGYNYYLCVPMIIGYFLLYYERLGYKNKPFVHQIIFVICLVLFIYIFSHHVMPEHFYDILKLKAAPSLH